MEDEMTERPYTRVIAMLNEAGLRPTRQRLALAKLLFDTADRHVTAEELHAEALRAGVSVSLATVYNTLHQFTGAGLMREVVVEPGRSYFDTNTSDHHHFFFEDSGDIQDIPEEAVNIAALPSIPPGTRLNRVDVVVRLSGEPPREQIKTILNS
jgi:Fur family transcriptional regulator, iron response regulator